MDDGLREKLGQKKTLEVMIQELELGMDNDIKMLEAHVNNFIQQASTVSEETKKITKNILMSQLEEIASFIKDDWDDSDMDKRHLLVVEGLIEKIKGVN